MDIFLEVHAYYEYDAYMSRKQKSQYTIRSIPLEIDKLLRKKAREEQISLNRAAIKALEESLGAGNNRLYDDLDFAIDSWESEKSVKANRKYV